MTPQIKQLIREGILNGDGSLNFEEMNKLQVIGEGCQSEGDGDDARHQVLYPTQYPYWPVVRLILTGVASNGVLRHFRGTGFLIAEDKILTAGQCIYDKLSGTLMHSIVAVVAPGNSKAHVATCTGFRTNYYPTPSELNDWALLRIDTKLGDATGCLPILDVDRATIPSMVYATAEVPGYPSVIRKMKTSCMWTASGLVEHYDSKRKIFNYNITTCAGNIGAPVMTQLAGCWYAIGIHTKCRRRTNIARAIDTRIFDESSALWCQL